MFQIKDEKGLHKLGLQIDDANPNRAVPLGSPSVTENETSESYITPENVIQLEKLVRKAAEEVERCDAADQAAEDKVAQLDTERQEAEAFRQKTACDRIAAYWKLGGAIVELEAALAENKGKHSENTPRKRAIELAGGNSRHQRAKAIYLHFDSQDDAEEAANWKSFTKILNDISEKKAEVRKENGQKTPGRSPIKKAVKKAVPKPKNTKVSEAEIAPPVVEDEESQSSEEVPEEVQPSQEELEAVLNLVKLLGGWTRTISLIKEVHKQCAENQKG